MRILVLVFLLCSHACCAQSYVGLALGVDAAQIREFNPIPNFQYFWVYEHGFSARSLFFGLTGEQKMSKSLSLSLQLTYTKKEFAADRMNLVSIEGLKFNQYRSTLSLRWHVLEKWHLGSGLSLNYLSNVTEFFNDGVENPFPINNKKEFGGIVSTGFRHQNFLAELYFNKPFTPTRKESYDFKPINSFGLSVSYLLQVGKRKK